MKKPIVAMSVSLMMCAPAIASNWHFIWVGNDDTKYFFDADTVEKGKDKTILMWVKTVQTTKPDSDGSWATAYRWKLNCTKRTIQTLMWSTYEPDGKFIKSNSNASSEQAVVPDSTGEATLKIACEPSFPNDKAAKNYIKLENNDPFLATRNIVEYQKSQIDQAPK